MARAKKTKMQATTEDTKAKPVRLDLSPESHRILRIVSSHADQSMAAYARDVVDQHIRAEAKRLGIRL